MSVNKTMRRRNRGAAMVEFALTFTIFLLIVLGTMELALTYFAWNRVSEAARAGSRFLIVNAPLDVAGVAAQSCSAEAPPLVSVDCASATCTSLLEKLQAHASFVEAAHVDVEYRCSGAGNPSVPDENRVRTVTLSISGVPHPQVITALLGLGWTGTPFLPPVSVTRTGEDLHSPAI